MSVTACRSGMPLQKFAHSIAQSGSSPSCKSHLRKILQRHPLRQAVPDIAPPILQGKCEKILVIRKRLCYNRTMTVIMCIFKMYV